MQLYDEYLYSRFILKMYTYIIEYPMIVIDKCPDIAAVIIVEWICIYYMCIIMYANIVTRVVSKVLCSKRSHMECIFSFYFVVVSAM